MLFGFQNTRKSIVNQKRKTMNKETVANIRKNGEVQLEPKIH